MKLCFPVAQDKGLESEVFGHFGSAPLFIVVDTEARTTSSINNNNQHHAQGMCNPIMALDNQHVDAIVVGGIGAGALNKLNASGIRVFQARAATVQDNVDLFAGSNLPEFTLQQCCGGHGPGSGCAH
jgi:predicted Fe-Mo cluster-binding NifX family protein